MSQTASSTQGPAPSRPILSARGVSKSFGIGDRTLEILHGVDLDLHRGELLALTGTSGAGKSTLLHILGLLDRPSEGRVTLDGVSAWELSLAERALIRNQRIGFVFQFYHLLPELDAIENVMLPAMIHESRAVFSRKRREHAEHARELLATFGLADRGTHRPSQLSGGERQRVALARALFHDPEILIADEPTGNLDSATGEKVLELIFREQERRKLSLLLVTHDERLAQRCSRRLFMTDGMISSERLPSAAAREESRARRQRISAPVSVPLYPVPTHKFLLMTVLSCGLYPYYWCYQNWKRLKRASGEELSPFWRAFFSNLWVFSLFPRIQKLARSNGVAVGWSGGVLATLHLLILSLGRISEPWSWVSFAAVLAMLPVQRTAQRVNAAHPASGVEPARTRYGLAEFVMIALGLLLFLLLLLGGEGSQ
jgi:lipoprotein-releasing system ATP-binding protein